MARREAVRCSIDAAASPASPATSDFTTDSCLCCAASVASRATWLANARGATEGATSPRRVLRGLRTARGLAEAALLLGVAGAPAVGAMGVLSCQDLQINNVAVLVTCLGTQPEGHPIGHQNVIFDLSTSLRLDPHQWTSACHSPADRAPPFYISHCPGAPKPATNGFSHETTTP